MGQAGSTGRHNMTGITTMTLTEQRTLGAFKLAMRELGVPEHPDGQ
jgi:hypothetical protein